MSRALASLLDIPERTLAKALAKLEDKNGYPSHDVRHLAAAVQKTRQKIAELGLDPDDTNGKELYHALLVKFKKDAQAFEISQGFYSDNFGQTANKAIDIIEQAVSLPERWVLKNSVAKSMLKQHQPKKVMKQLGYRSIDSMLKRESIGRLFVLANLEESLTWQKELGRIISHQDTSHFELRVLSFEAITDVAWNGSPLQYNDDVGALALLETPPSGQMPLLSIMVLLIDGLKNFKQIKLSEQLMAISPLLSWWSDMDGLVCKLNDEVVSLNIKDASLNQAHAKEYDHRILSAGRSSFWHELLSRYENQLAIEEDILSSLEQKIVPVKIPIRQPVFEYVEDF